MWMVVGIGGRGGGIGSGHFICCLVNPVCISTDNVGLHAIIVPLRTMRNR